MTREELKREVEHLTGEQLLELLRLLLTEVNVPPIPGEKNPYGATGK